MEEVDLAWRLKRMGYRIGYCAKSVVYHVGGGTLHTGNPQKTFLNFRNSLYMLQKNLSFGAASWAIFARLWIDLIALLHFVSKGKFRDAWAVSRAHQQFFLNIMKTARKRTTYTGVFQKAGYYRGSIVWAFYALGKTTFGRLNKKRFL